jgi:hypothetical protein
MNVGIRIEAAQFHFWEYINRIYSTVQRFFVDHSATILDPQEGRDLATRSILKFYIHRFGIGLLHKC